jgi:putative peptidoglycan lipid II flippase
MPETGLGKSSLIAGAGTLCSRLLGFARDAALAWVFGASGTADALATALRLPYLARRLYGEGALSLELTVHCVRARRGDALAAASDDGAGSASGNDVFLALAVGRYVLVWGLAFVLIGLLAARPILLALAPGLAGSPEILDEAVAMFRVCLPYIPAAALAATCMAVLHGRERFGLPALTPSLFNVIVLLSAGLALCGAGDPGLPGGLVVAAGVVCGGLAQWGAQMPVVRRLGREFPPRNPPDPAVIRAVACGLPLGLLGAAAPQCIFLAAAGLTSLVPGSSLAALFYAERLLEFPLGVCGAAVGMAAAPRLAAAGAAAGAATGAAAGADAGRAVLEPLKQALELSWLCSLPAAAGLAAVSLPLTLALFGHGAFDAEAARLTSLLVCAYAPGLPAYAASRPLLAACHALGNRRAPVYGMLAGLIATLGAAGAAGAALIFDFALPGCGPAGPPFCASLGLWVYVLALGLGVRRACGALPVPWRTLGRNLWPAVGGSLLTYWCAAWLAEIASGPVTALALAVPGGIAAYASALCVLDARWRNRLLQIWRTVV